MSRHTKTLAAIFATPTRASIKWNDVKAMLSHEGADVDESAAGSRVGITLSGAKMTLHKPHPGKELKKYAIEQLREFLADRGVRPEGPVVQSEDEDENEQEA